MSAGNLFRQYFAKVYLWRPAGQFISESHCLAQCTGHRIGAELAPQIRAGHSGWLCWCPAETVRRTLSFMLLQHKNALLRRHPGRARGLLSRQSAAAAECSRR
jgi:hypothetical protein